MLLVPSTEQLDIVTSFKAGTNISANCVAGSGKTTTCMLLANATPERRILMITYNTALKLEVREKLQHAGIKNVEMHTYHGACLKWYGDRTNERMKAVCDDHSPPRPSKPYDVLIVDEVQDATPDYFRFASKLYQDLSCRQLVLLGDEKQCIYRFQGSDHRFLTLCEMLWEMPFVRHTLSTSYRVTEEIAAFVNVVMLGTPKIQAQKSGPPVKYVVTNPYNTYLFRDLIRKRIKEGAKPDDFFILSTTMNGTRLPVRSLEMALVREGIPCYFPTGEDRELKDSLLRGKVVFSSVHQSKGRQRPIVIVFGFDQTYFDIFDRDNIMPRTECPDLLYVAATRAERELILIQDERAAPCPFFCVSVEDLHTRPYMQVLGAPDPSGASSIIARPFKVNVTDLVKHIHPDAGHVLSDYVATVYTRTRDPSFDIDIPNTIVTSLGLEEDISDINGIILPAIQEHEKTGSSTILNTLRVSRPRVHSESDEFEVSIDDTQAPCLSPRQWISVGIEYISRGARLLHKEAQIPQRDRTWLDNGHYRVAVNFLHEYMQYFGTVIYERQLKCMYSDSYCGRIEVSGRIDVQSNNTVLEIKCTKDLTMEHKLQLLVYAWMYRKTVSDEHTTAFRLLNIRTGEEYTLEASYALLTEIVSYLIASKYAKQVVITDHEFVEKHASQRITTKALVQNMFESDDEEPVIRERAPARSSPPAMAKPKGGPMDKFLVRK